MTKAKPSPSQKWIGFPESSVKGRMSKENLERAVSKTMKLRLTNGNRSLSDYPEESL